MAFDDREQSYVGETRAYTERVIQLHDFIERANQRLEQGWDPEKEVSEAFKEQVKTLEGQLETKDSQNEKLKQQLRKALNGQREDVTSTIKDFRKYLTHMSEIEKQTEEKLSEFLFERQENDKVSNDRERADADKIDQLSQENSKLRFKIRELEATNKEKEFVQLQSAYVK